MRITRAKSGYSILAAGLLTLASCATFAPPERTAEPLPLPEQFTIYEDTAPAPDRWWEGLESEELNGLVAEALRDNFTLQQAYARLVQAANVARQAGALRWPGLSVTGDASATRQHTDTGASTGPAEQLQEVSSTLAQVESIVSFLTGGGTVSGGAPTQSAQPSERTFTTESYRFGLASSYELDLWGRVRSQHQAARADLDASYEDVCTAMFSLAAEVTLNWLDILAYNQTLALLHEQLEANRTRLDLMELRYRKGLATALDVYQQRQVVAQTESTIPPLEARLGTAHHQLAVLLGNAPRTGLDLTDAAFPSIGALPEAGVPADLLARRPDVRAAGLRLRAADWRVSAARADRLPGIQLTASASYGAEEWSLVFDNWMSRLAGSLTGSIFDAGRRRAEVERTRAVVDERLAAYRQAVLTAIREVEDALINETKQAEYIEALDGQLAVARASQREALGRYQKGLNDYLPVLNALTAVQSLERTLVEANRARLGYRVQLCRALGGSWMHELLRQEKGSPHDVK